MISNYLDLLRGKLTLSAAKPPIMSEAVLSQCTFDLLWQGKYDPEANMSLLEIESSNSESMVNDMTETDFENEHEIDDEPFWDTNSVENKVCQTEFLSISSEQVRQLRCNEENRNTIETKLCQMWKKSSIWCMVSILIGHLKSQKYINIISEATNARFHIFEGKKDNGFLQTTSSWFVNIVFLKCWVIYNQVFRSKNTGKIYGHVVVMPSRI